jgi:rRNA methylases
MNLGAIIRTSTYFGVDRIIVTEKNRYLYRSYNLSFVDTILGKVKVIEGFLCLEFIWLILFFYRVLFIEL